MSAENTIVPTQESTIFDPKVAFDLALNAIKQRIAGVGMEIGPNDLGIGSWRLIDPNPSYIQATFFNGHSERLTEEGLPELVQAVLETIPPATRIALQNKEWLKNREEKLPDNECYAYQHIRSERNGYIPIFKESAMLASIDKSSKPTHLPTGLSVDKIDHEVDFDQKTVKFRAFHDFKSYAANGFTFAHDNEDEVEESIDSALLTSWELPLHPDDTPQILEEATHIKYMSYGEKYAYSISVPALFDDNNNLVGIWSKKREIWMKGAYSLMRQLLDTDPNRWRYGNKIGANELNFYKGMQRSMAQLPNVEGRTATPKELHILKTLFNEAGWDYEGLRMLSLNVDEALKKADLLEKVLQLYGYQPQPILRELAVKLDRLRAKSNQLYEPKSLEQLDLPRLTEETISTLLSEVKRIDSQLLIRIAEGTERITKEKARETIAKMGAEILEENRNYWVIRTKEGEVLNLGVIMLRQT